MRGVWLKAGAAAAVGALVASAVVSADVADEAADVAHVVVVAGDTSAMQIARRLCGVDAPAALGQTIFEMNRDLFAVLHVGEVLHVPASCPEVPPSTTTTTTEAPTTSTSTTSTTPPTTSTTSLPAATTTVPAGTGPGFSSGFASSGDLAAFTSSWWRAEGPPDAMGTPASGIAANGRLVVDTFVQNYGETTLRANTPIDLSGSATVEFDVTLPAGDRGLNGWPVFTITERPHATLTCDNNGCDDDIAGGEAIRVEFKLNNSAPLVNGDSQANFSDPSGVMRHVTATIVGDEMELCVEADCWTYEVPDMESGYVTVGGHNHATGKYGFGDFARAEFDNLAFSPTLAPVTSVPNGGTLAAGPGFIVMNVGVDASNPDPQLTYTLNGGAPVTVPVGWRMGHSRGLSIPVVFAEGANTVTYTLSDAQVGPTPAVANVHLVSTGGAPSTPTTSTTSTTLSPTTTSTASATTSTASAPTTTAPAATTTTQPATTTTQPPSGLAFAEAFTSAASLDRFVMHMGNACSYDQLCRPENQPDWATPITEWSGDHSMACEGPTTARTVHVAHRDELVWWCGPRGPESGHVMTSVNTLQYNILTLSPDQTFTDVRRVCWDINATNLGGGKWFNVILVPESEYVRHPNTAGRHEAEGPYRMDYTTFGFNDPNAPGDFNLQLSDLQPGVAPYGLKDQQGHLALFRGNDVLWQSPGTSFTDDKAARFKHCMTEEVGGLRITRVNPSGTTDSYLVPGQSLPDGRVRVLFQDDNYDPPKRDGYSEANLTWHLDNIEISS